MSADKYSRDESESQVRSIIKQLNEERPSKEKSREVVVRPDGTKVVRVIKKRKVMISNVEKSRHARKRFLLLLLLLLIAGAAMAGIISVRMSAMAGESYIQKRQEELCRAWGATSVRCSGAGISGFSLRIESLVAEFPEPSIIKRVELRNITAALASTSFFSGVPESEELKIDSAVIFIREGVQNFAMPLQEGKDLWKMKRVTCDKLSCYVGDENASPLSIKQAAAYMYYPASGKSSRVLILNNGVLHMQGWKPIVITDAKMLFSPTAVEDIHITGTLDTDKKEQDTASTTVALSGNIRAGAQLAGPFTFESTNINFSDLSEGRFVQFFNGTTTKERGQSVLTAYITLPLERPAPLFSGAFRLKDVRVTSLPALMMIADHLEPIRRKSYLPPNISEATVELIQNEEGTTLSIANGNAIERELISLRAEVKLDTSNQLSGTMDYGIPAKLTHMEYPDGLADPIFSDDGVYAWFATKLRGPANMPSDNSAELDAQAAAVRVERPARIPFDEIDIDDFSDKMKAKSAGSLDSKPTADRQETAPKQPTQTEQPGQQSAEPVQAPANDLDLNKLPTSLPMQQEQKPSDGGLSLPTDDSFFPGLYH